MTQNRNNEKMHFVMKNSPNLLHLGIKSCSFIWGNVRYNFRLIGVDLGSSWGSSMCSYAIKKVKKKYQKTFFARPKLLPL